VFCTKTREGGGLEIAGSCMEKRLQLYGSVVKNHPFFEMNLARVTTISTCELSWDSERSGRRSSRNSSFTLMNGFHLSLHVDFPRV